MSHRKGYPINMAMKSSETLPMAYQIGAWLSPARALGSGPRGREFESPRPDKEKGEHDGCSPFLFPSFDSLRGP